MITNVMNSWYVYPDSRVYGAYYMGPIWDRQDPDGPHVVPMNFAIWVGHDEAIQGD